MGMVPVFSPVLCVFSLPVASVHRQAAAIMKCNKYIAMLSALLSVAFTACDVETDEEPGGTVM